MTEPRAAAPVGGDGDPRDARPVEEWSFEELMDALEALTARLAQGDLGIEQAADLYEQAERLHALASERLAKVQERVAGLARKPPAPQEP